MAEALPEQARSFPAPVRIDGYFAWTWRLFRASFLRLGSVFVAGLVLTSLAYYYFTVFLVDVLEVRATINARALAFAAEVTLSTVTGSALVAIAATVFLRRLSGHDTGADAGWRRLKPRFGHVVVSALYVAMPLLLLVVFLRLITQLVLVPALLGPPVLVHAIVWEHLDFRGAATRAKNLLSGHWGRVAAALLVLALGAVLVQIAVLTVVSVVLPDLNDAGLVGSLWTSIVAGMSTAPVWLFTAAAGTVAYLDLRARFEDLDHAGLVAEAEGVGAPS